VICIDRDTAHRTKAHGQSRAASRGIAHLTSHRMESIRFCVGVPCRLVHRESDNRTQSARVQWEPSPRAKLSPHIALYFPKAGEVASKERALLRSRLKPQLALRRPSSAIPAG
jgi:hypothetical protein